MNYTIYGAGDRGTKALCRVFVARSIPYVFVDIRAHLAGDTKALAFLIHHRLLTVPQVFNAAGVHIGDYDAAISHLDGRG